MNTMRRQFYLLKVVCFKQGFLLACLIASFVMTASAQVEDVESAPFSLLDSSPFVPDGWVKPTKGSKGKSESQGRDIQFRGYYTNLKNVTKFHIYDKKQRISNWLELKKEKQGLLVQAWDAEEKSITLSVNGKSDRFELIKPDDKPLLLTKKTGRSSRKSSVRNRRQEPTSTVKPRRTVRKPISRRNTNTNRTSTSRVRPRSSGTSKSQTDGSNLTPPTLGGDTDSGSGDSGDSGSGNDSGGSSNDLGLSPPSSPVPDFTPGAPPSEKPPGY